MTLTLARKNEVRIKAPELRGAAFQLGSISAPEVGIEGRAGTGKTVGICFKVHLFHLLHPGVHGLMARKYMTDLTASAVATYRALLDPRHRVRMYGGSRFEPPGFQYPNGSVLYLSGLDDPSKVQSKEFDIAFINEVTECTLDDIEFVSIRLRPRLNGPEVPYRQLIMDCNPSFPTHWFNERMKSGQTLRLISQWEDNPRFYDLATQDWTEAGREYIFGKLATLTGVRRARFFAGLWAAAEGTVYEDSWDASRNIVKPFPIPREWPRYLWIDFGYTNPFVCHWAAQDPDGRLYVYRELYMTKRLVEDHARQIKRESRWGEDGGDPLPRGVICDHDAEGRATLEAHLGLLTTPAIKSVSDGIQAMAARLLPAGDGRPRLLYFEHCLVERDSDLTARKKPTSVVEEFDSYVWEETTKGIKETPKKEDDHGMDTDRYGVAYFDLRPSDVRYSSRWY